MRTPIPSAHAALVAASIVGCATAPRQQSAGSTQTGAASSARNPADATLAATIRARLDSLQAQSSFYAKHLTSGREVAVRADVPMNTASVIKIPVMILAFRDHEAGRLDLDQRYVVRPEDLRRGSGLIQSFAVGLQPTLRDLVTQMIITSDNTATDILIAKVGRDRVNRMLDSLGYRETRLIMSTGDLFRTVWTQLDAKYASLTDREVFERGFPNDSGAGSRTMVLVADSSKWLGRTTAREISRLLEQLQRGELSNRESTQQMMRILRQQLYASRLPQRIRFRAGIAHKTGDWPPLLGNDVGIVFSETGPIVMAVFTNTNRGDFFDLEAAEGRIAEDVLDAWGRR